MSNATIDRKLVQEFHQRMIGVHDAAKSECNYHATRFVNLVHEYGGVEAAKRLLSSKGFPEGLTRLWELGRLDISMEALVAEEKWASLFTADEIAGAKKRLAELGYSK